MGKETRKIKNLKHIVQPFRKAGRPGILRNQDLQNPWKKHDNIPL